MYDIQITLKVITHAPARTNIGIYNEKRKILTPQSTVANYEHIVEDAANITLYSSTGIMLYLS